MLLEWWILLQEWRRLRWWRRELLQLCGLLAILQRASAGVAIRVVTAGVPAGIAAASAFCGGVAVSAAALAKK